MSFYEFQQIHITSVSSHSVCFIVSVEGVVALGGHFATLCHEVDFYEAFFFHFISYSIEMRDYLKIAKAIPKFILILR